MRLWQKLKIINKTMIYDNSKNQVIIYNDRVEVRFEGETVWLSQAQLVELFQSSKANVSVHIKNIFTERELLEKFKNKYRIKYIYSPRLCLGVSN